MLARLVAGAILLVVREQVAESTYSAGPAAASAGARAERPRRASDPELGAWRAFLRAGTAAAVALLEHRWAIPLRDKIAQAGGLTLSDAWIHVADLVAVGAVAGEKAKA